MDDHRRGLNKFDAADYLGISINTLIRLSATELLLRPVRISERRIVWDKRDLDAYMTKQKKARK
jgi:predicted DNA-binding transcriptional regulator AlpA